MDKFALLHAYLQEKGIATIKNTYRPGRARLELLTLGHDSDYIERFIAGTQTPAQLRTMGLPWSKPLVARTLISPNGTLLSALMARSCLHYWLWTEVLLVIWRVARITHITIMHRAFVFLMI